MSTEATPAPTPAAPAAAPTSGATAPAATPPTPSSSSDFISEAMRQLAPHQEGAPKAETPVETPPPPKAETAPEPPKTDAPKAEAPPVDDEEGKKAEEDIKRETASMPAPQKAAFTKLRYELRDKNRQLKAALEAQQQQGGEKTADPELTAEVERLRAENAKAQEKLAQFDSEFFATRVELTDEFKAQVAQPRETIAKSIGEIADRYEGLPPQDVVRAVQSGDPAQVARVTADMAEYDRYRFYQLVDRFQEIARVEQTMRANAKDTLEKIETERRSRTEQQTAREREEWKTSLEQVWEKIVEDFPVLAPIEGADEWNKQVEKVRSFAAPDRFGKLTVRERAETLYRAAAFPALVAELESARESAKSAQEKLSKYESVSPSVDTAGGGGPAPEIGPDTDMNTAISALFKKAGLG